MTKKLERKKFGERIYGVPVGADRSKLSERDRKFLEHLDTMEKCASAIGNLCFAWAVLEQQIGDLISGILEIPDTKLSETLLANIDPRNKMQIVLGLGHLRRVSDEWFDILKWCVNTTDGDLRIRRNRFVHDIWHVSPDGIKRIQQRTGFRKGQAFQPPEYYTSIQHATIDEKEIESLNSDIQKMTLRFEYLWLAGKRKDVDWKKLLEEHAPLPPHRPK